MYRLMKKKMPNIPKDTENATVLPALNAGTRKNDRGSIAWGARCSHASRATISAAPSPRLVRISGSLHPRSFASINPYTSPNRPAVPRASPGRSSLRASSDRDSRTTRTATRNPAMPIGTLRKNTDSQPKFSTIQPPRVGPSASATPETPAQIPIALARSSGGNVTVRIESVPGISIAAPMPCRTRKTISWLLVDDSPEPSDASVKIVRPVRKIRFRPNRSPSVPPVRSSDANASA